MDQIFYATIRLHGLQSEERFLVTDKQIFLPVTLSPAQKRRLRKIARQKESGE